VLKKSKICLVSIFPEGIFNNDLREEVHIDTKHDLPHTL